jgi:hypothetical protein
MLTILASSMPLADQSAIILNRFCKIVKGPAKSYSFVLRGLFLKRI